jgi:hypothetical protein
MDAKNFIKEFKTITLKNAGDYLGINKTCISSGKISDEKATLVVDYIVTNFMQIYSEYLLNKELKIMDTKGVILKDYE